MTAPGLGARKRVYSTVTVTEGSAGFTVALDGRPIRSPGGRPLALPTRSLAEAIAAEWDAQADTIDPRGMPATGFAATVADRVTPQRDHVVDEIAGYGGSDLLCFLTEDPPELIARQEAAWRPWREWAERTLGLTLVLGAGIMPVRQPEGTLAAFRAAVAAEDAWTLAPLHDLTSITGSLILGLAVLRGRLGAETAFEVSRVDEEFQAERWGRDAEAEDFSIARHREMVEAATFVALLKS
ncbi:MAG: ATPase [Alphaproteobacteria bacterium]|nr:ATPase [Alphaproteobacteria bacterium]